MDYGGNMTKQEILDRIQNVLYQDVDTESGDLDLLRHDLELDIIESETNYGRRKDDKVKEQFNRECG